MAKKDKKKKEPKRKPKYGMLSCVGYIYRLLWNTERGLAFTGIFTVPLSLILAALALYTPTLILRALETSGQFSYIALVILGLLLAKLLFDLADNVIQQRIGNAEHYVLLRMTYIEWAKYRERDFYFQYDPEINEMDERAEQAITNNHTAGVHFPMAFSNMLSSLLQFFLFGTVISLLNPVIILLLALGCVINYFMSKWERTKNWNDRDILYKNLKKIEYLSFDVSRDFQYAKDIRLNKMRGGLFERLQILLKQDRTERIKRVKRRFLTALVSFLVVLFRDGLAYIFLIYKAVQGEVDASSFLLYFSAITSMSGLMGGIIGTINWVSDGALQISDYREAMDLQDKHNRGVGAPIPTAPFSIEFKHVSYKYPQGEKKVLDDISFKIEAGEKIALVGLNGAGKTTMTMLMCGLLLPDDGEVLLNGKPLTAYNRDEMYSLFGLIPQKYSLLPVSIARNIASALTDEEVDRDRLAHCIELAGLSEKIASLPNGAETPLNREINRDGIELSGGEVQRLLLARLLYKDPLCLILDEPTAALDPIAEDRMYRKYNEIASRATSIFISHRLASTRFCDRIFLLDGAKFAEVGTHDELMALGGKYRELFDVQSKYYQEGVVENEKVEG